MVLISRTEYFFQSAQFTFNKRRSVIDFVLRRFICMSNGTKNSDIFLKEYFKKSKTTFGWVTQRMAK